MFLFQYISSKHLPVLCQHLRYQQYFPPPAMSQSGPVDSHETARDELTSRTVPMMKFSDGSTNSLTPPTAPPPAHLSAVERAMRRFAVHGNAVSTSKPRISPPACQSRTCMHALMPITLSILYQSISQTFTYTHVFPTCSHIP